MTAHNATAADRATAWPHLGSITAYRLRRAVPTPYSSRALGHKNGRLSSIEFSRGIFAQATGGFVTKYRRQTLTEPLLKYLETAFGEILKERRTRRVRGRRRHVHLLVDIHPALDLSVLIGLPRGSPGF
jgi:hypothetical protein